MIVSNYFQKIKEELLKPEFNVIDFLGEDFMKRLALYEKNIADLKKIIMADRNGDGKFDIEDLKLIYKDIYALISIASIFILSYSSISQNEINNDEILNICLYTFMTSFDSFFSCSEKKEEDEEKKIILLIIGSVFDLLSTSTKIKNLIEAIEKKCCSLCFKQSNTKKINGMLSVEKSNLQHIIKVNRNEFFQSEHQN